VDNSTLPLLPKRVEWPTKFLSYASVSTVEPSFETVIAVDPFWSIKRAAPALERFWRGGEIVVIEKAGDVEVQRVEYLISPGQVPGIAIFIGD
jgi:hypothetical protein